MQDYIITSGGVEADRTADLQITECEKEFLQKARKQRRNVDVDAPWTGIALSGGGIRSATFGLGVIQALARENLLKEFDYISSVSGGSYLAASLQFWWNRSHQDPQSVAGTSGFGPKDFPYGSERLGDDEVKDTPAQRANLEFLRSHGYYLTPGNGLTAWSLLYVVFRTILVSLLVWIPLLVVAFLIVQSLDHFVVEWALRSFHAGAGILPFPEVVAQHWRLDSKTCSDPSFLKCAFSLRITYALLIWAYVVAGAVFLFSSLIFAFLSRLRSDITPNKGTSCRAVGAFALAVVVGGYAVFTPLPSDMVPFLLWAAAILIGSCLLIYALLEAFRERAVNGSYWWRRKLEVIFGTTFLPSLAILLFGLIPVLSYFLALRLGISGPSVGAAATTGVASVVSGSVSAVYGYYTFVQKIDRGLAGRIFSALGSAIFLYGTLTVAYILSLLAFDALFLTQTCQIATDCSYFIKALDKWIGHGSIREVVLTWSIIFLGIGTFLAAVTNINVVGLHRFYRDRLMEVFLPSPDAIERGATTYSPVADKLSLSDLSPSYASSPFAPYPLINALGRIVKKADRRAAARGGENFILSPLFVGCRATGWNRTSKFIDRYGPLTLASSMAASGAAINSNAGYVGTGITRDTLVSAMMTILNMRLGIWVGNPGKMSRGFRRIPTYIHPTILSGLLKIGQSPESRFIEISDGGNFDNLGLYELIRRRVGLMLVIDGEADPTISLTSLVSVITRVRDDFQANVSFDLADGAGRLMPVPKSGDGQYPAGAVYAKAPYMVGTVTYQHPDDKPGLIIYVKATLIKKLSFTTEGYRALNADFPHQETVDQFFDPMQFEAYRDLGHCSGRLVISELQLKQTIGSTEKIKDVFVSLKPVSTDPVDEQLKHQGIHHKQSGERPGSAQDLATEQDRQPESKENSGQYDGG